MPASPSHHSDNNDDDGQHHTRSARELADDAQHTRENAPLRWKIFSLVCTLLIAIGSHFSAHVFSSLKATMKEELGISNAQYGVLQAAVPLISTILPILGGRLIDVAGVSTSSIVFSLFITGGELLVAIAASSKSFALMVVGRVLFGVGSSTLVTLQHTVMSHWFRGNGLAVAVGLAMAVSRLSSYLSVLITVPIRDATGWYGYAIWVSVILCAASFVVNVVYVLGMRSFHKQSSTGDIVSEEELRKIKMKNKFDVKDVYRFNATYWVVAWFSFAAGGVWTAFVHIAPEMVKLRFGQGDSRAGYIASYSQIAPIILSPFCGYVMDAWGKRPLINMASTLCLLGSLLLLWLTKLTPIVGFLLFSVSLTFGPVAMVSSIGLLIRPESIGTALGIYKSLANVASTMLEPLVGLLQDQTGGYTAPLILLALVTGAALLLSVLLMVLDARRAGYVLSANREDRKAIVEHQNELDSEANEDENNNNNNNHDEEDNERTSLLRSSAARHRATRQQADGESGRAADVQTRSSAGNILLGKVMVGIICVLVVCGWVVYGLLFTRSGKA